MRATANLSVKGTSYYKAAELLQNGALSSGLAIRLQHQPNNPHDKNAVAVLVKMSGAMLGHISKELAPKYAALLNSGSIIEASIANIDRNGAHINIDVRVVYDQYDDQLAEKHSSRLWGSASVLPTETGVYAIRNIESGRQYIGSSNNIKDRVHSHIRDLSLGCHANHVLQSDFSSLGLNHFEAKVLVRGVSPSNLAKAESDSISSLLNAGAALYNLTADGQGRVSRGNSKLKPISDRLAEQHAEAEKRRIDAVFAEKRKKIIDEFEPKLAATLPEPSFWAYFAIVFFVTLIISGGMFILATILAFIGAPLIQNHIKEKGKGTPAYQDLLNQRELKLAALKNEGENQNF
jgi:hypothetical protein